MMQEIPSIFWILIPIFAITIVMIFAMRPQQEGSKPRRGLFMVSLIGGIVALALFFMMKFVLSP